MGVPYSSISDGPKLLRACLERVFGPDSIRDPDRGQPYEVTLYMAALETKQREEKIDA
jgi:hypothetical protein